MEETENAMALVEGMGACGVEVMEDAADDALFSPGISLPTYADVNDKKVLGSVKQIFRNFTYDKSDSYDYMQNADAIADYIRTTREEIAAVKCGSDKVNSMNNAAIAARFWYMSDIINKALNKGNPGDHVIDRLMEVMQPPLKRSTLYAYRNVARTLTVEECWLLGSRGCQPAHLRQFASIKDDKVRRGVIKAFIEQYTDTSNLSLCEQVRKQLTAAQDSRIQEAFDDELASNTDVPVLTDAPEEYDSCLKRLKAISRMTTQLANNDKFVEARDSCGMVYMPDTVLGAHEKVEALKDVADRIIANMDAVIDHLTALKPELQSLVEALHVTDADGNNVVDA